MTTQPGSDGRLLPAVAAIDVKVEIDKQGLEFSLRGNFWTKVFSWFDAVFAGMIINKIEPILVEQLEAGIPPMMNTKLQLHDGFATPFATYELFNTLTIDLGVSYTPMVKDKRLIIGFNGGIHENEFPA